PIATNVSDQRPSAPFSRNEIGPCVPNANPPIQIRREGSVSTVSAASPPFSMGAEFTFHCLPSQCSTSAGPPASPHEVTVHPTAQMSVDEMALRSSNMELMSLGLPTMFHSVPFQCSISALAPT